MHLPSSLPSCRWGVDRGGACLLAMLLVLVLNISRSQSVIPPDREGLLRGQGMELAAIAESNNWPDSKQVLAMKNELGLTRDQVKKTEALEKVTGSAAGAKGEEIVQAEEELADMFQSGTASEKAVRTKLEHIGKARAELRFIHLQAYLRMKQILTPDQVKQYAELKARESKREN